MVLASTSHPSRVSCFFIVRCKKFSTKLHTVDIRKKFRRQLNRRVDEQVLDYFAMDDIGALGQHQKRTLQAFIAPKVVDHRYHDYKYCRNCSKAGINVYS